MKKIFWLISCLVWMCCLPLQSRAQYNSTVAAPPVQYSDETVTEAPVYERRKIPDSLVNELKADKKLQYHDIKKEKPRDMRWLDRFMDKLIASLGLLRIIIMVLLLAGLGLLLYWFMKSNGISFFRKPPVVKGLEEIQEEALQSAQEYEEKIKAAVAANDRRQAIRWWYLFTLFQLAGREMIVAGREKTNNDYLRNMRGSPYYKIFATLTLDYEYIWYGGFEVSEENFRNIDQEFRNFNNAIGKAS